MKRSENKAKAGFTLLEIMIVVSVIALLAIMAYPAYSEARETTQQTTFINEMRVFSGAAEVYMLDSGEYLEDSSTGTVPAGWAPYIDTDSWTSGTPIGGSWDMELDSYGVKAAFGVVFSAGAPSAAYMQEIDERFDDGDVITGSFRRIAPGRYYYILEE